MNRTIDLDAWFRSDRSVAAVAPAEALFGLLKRSLDLSNTFVAKATRKDGSHRIYGPGEAVPSSEVTEVFFVRSQPIELAFSIAQVQSQDRYLCDSHVTLQARVLPEKGELDSFRDRVMGSQIAVDISAVENHLRATVDRAVRDFADGHPAAELIDGKQAAAAAAALEEALKAPCFAGGMNVESTPNVTFHSESYSKVRRAEELAARQLGEHQAQRELRDAISQAQCERMEHLEGMLTRLKQLADDSPQVDLPELMRAFDETQRGQLYQALFESRSRQRSTQWIVAVAGHDLLFFDPQSPADPVRTVTINGEAGALRSVQIGRRPRGPSAESKEDSEPVLLIGAARGVYEMAIGGFEPDCTYLFEPKAGVRGGVNAVALHGGELVATHSEQGVLCWKRGRPDSVRPLLAELTAGAKAVRHAQFDGDWFWCSIDEKVVGLPAGDLDAAPRVIDASRSTITALHVCGERIYAGNADGEVLAWEHAGAAGPQLLHAGSRRAAESVRLMMSGGIPRIFYTDTSLAIYSRVVGDTFTCRYEAGGQTVRRAECAEDVIAGTTDARDRVIVWAPDKPGRAAGVIAVSRLTGRSIQDVCLVPAA